MTDDLDPLISSDDLAVLLGVPVELLKACAAAQSLGTGGVETARFPGAWLEQGRSRTEIYKRATGRDDMKGAIEFWKAQRKGTR